MDHDEERGIIGAKMRPAMAIVLLGLLPATASMSLAESEKSASESAPVAAAADARAAKKPEPFAFADFTWLTGNPRTRESPLDTKVSPARCGWTSPITT